jgi:hypothetical protein
VWRTLRASERMLISLTFFAAFFPNTVDTYKHLFYHLQVS